jgi:hypothetical protein
MQQPLLDRKPHSPSLLTNKCFEKHLFASCLSRRTTKERGIFVPFEQELMEIHVNVLFRQNDAGFLTDINEPPYDPAPRLFLGATRAGTIYRYRHGLDSRISKKLESVIRPETDLAAIIRILESSGPITRVDIGPAFVFPEVRHRSAAAIRMTESNKELLRAHFPYTYEELAVKSPCFAVVQDGVAVSVCRSGRQTAAAAEASLDTIEAYRGRAYGVEVATAWAAEVQSQRRLALYSTAWDNFASQAVARKLQLIQYGTDVMID